MLRIEYIGLLILPLAVSAAVHTISVGQGGLKYSPDSIVAQVGDQVEFNFVSSLGHSVVEGDYDNPCQPLDASAFFSGIVSAGSQPWTITVKDTAPIWFYCGVPGHCQAGMVGVINAPPDDSVDDFANDASKTTGSKTPAKVQGGTFGAAQSGAASSSGSLVGSTTSAAAAPSAASSSQAPSSAAPSAAPSSQAPSSAAPASSVVASSSSIPSPPAATGGTAGKLVVQCGGLMAFIAGFLFNCL